MRWLWKDWPAGVKAGKGSSQLQEILVAGENWRLVGEGYQATEGPAVNNKGVVFFNDVGNNKTYRVSQDGIPKEFLSDSKRGDGQAFGPDGRLYANAAAVSQILSWDQVGKSAFVADGFRGNDLVVAHNGSLYATSARPRMDSIPARSGTSVRKVKRRSSIQA